MSNDLVKTDNGNGAQPVAKPEPTGPLAKFLGSGPKTWTTIKVESDRGREDYMKALGTADRLAKQCVGHELFIRDLLIHEVELTDDQTGEVFPAARLVLIEHNGNTISTTSDSLIGGFSHLLQLYGKGPWSPTLCITIKAVKARKMGEYLQIASVSQRSPESSKGKGKV